MQKGFINILEKKEINKLLKTLPDFQRRVLLKVAEIPMGETRSYKWVAEEIGCPKNIRQVARAISKNPYPIIIPCHRVIKSDGSLGGYIFGRRFKKILLDLEKRVNSVIMERKEGE